MACTLPLQTRGVYYESVKGELHRFDAKPRAEVRIPAEPFRPFLGDWYSIKTRTSNADHTLGWAKSV